jgi:hypothetical protein
MVFKKQIVLTLLVVFFFMSTLSTSAQEIEILKGRVYTYSAANHTLSILWNDKGFRRESFFAEVFKITKETEVEGIVYISDLHRGDFVTVYFERHWTRGIYHLIATKIIVTKSKW